MSTYYFAPGNRHVAVHRKATVRLAANGTIPLPKGCAVNRIYLHNRTANAVTGGIRVGNAAAGTQYVTAQAVAANALVRVTPTIDGLQKADSSIFVEAVTAWNGAIVDVVVTYEQINYLETEYEPGSLNLDSNVGKAHSSQ